MIKASEFISKARSRVAIYSRAETADGKGGATSAWTLLTTVWAYIEPYRGYERAAQGTLRSTFTSRVIIRYNSSLKNTAVTGRYKLVLNGRTFPIAAIKNMDEDMVVEGVAFQEIMCQENEAENAAG